MARPPIGVDTIQATEAGGASGVLTAWIVVASAGVAMLGFHWDIAWHTVYVRDRFATWPHLLILGSLAGGLVAASLRRRPARGTARPSWVAVIRGNRGAALALTATMATILALNVDDWWHVLFGFDITLWSPPHLVLSLGFLMMLLGGLTELADRGTDRRLLACVPGLMVATASLLVLEFELGFLHYDMHWEPLALAAMMGAGLALAHGVSALAWAGTIAGAAAVAARLTGLALNAVAGVALPTPPVGLIAAGFAFDVGRRWLRRRGLATGPSAAAAAVIAWLPMLAVTVAHRRLFGRTWWTSALVPRALVFGVVGAALGAAAGMWLARFARAAEAPQPASADPVRGRLRRAVRPVVAGLVVTAVIGLTGRVVLDDWSPDAVVAELARQDGDLVLTIPGATAADWAGVIGGRADRPERTEWLGSLAWSDGAFRGPAPSAGFIWEGIWFQGANRAWKTTRVRGHTAGVVMLERDAFRPQGAPPVAAVDVAASYAVLVVLVTAQVGLVAARQSPRRRRWTGGGP